jgi:hypothetical protein
LSGACSGTVLPEIKVLHFAPEEAFKRIFSRRFQQYETADLFMRGVDHKVDIRNLPFKDATYDFVFASGVLEHISMIRKLYKRFAGY